MKWERATLIIFFTALLLASAVGKLLDNQGFARVLATWQLFPQALLPAIGLAVGVAELLAGLGLLAGGRRRRWGASAAVALWSFYVLAEAIALTRGLDVPNAGTFGVYFADRLTWARLLQDVFVLCLAIALRRLQDRRASDHRSAVPQVRWASRR